MVRHRRKKNNVHKSEGKETQIPVHTGAVKPEPAMVRRAVVEQHERRTPEARMPRSINWKAAEFHYLEKDYLWYVGVVFIGVLLLAYAVWQKSYFFSIFIIIATTLVVEFGKRRPRVLEYDLGEKGISIDGTLYAHYEDLKSFYIRKRLGFLDEIVFQKTSRINPFIHLPIDEVLAKEARAHLLRYLPEAPHEETLVEIIAERIGF